MITHLYKKVKISKVFLDETFCNERMVEWIL